MVFTETVMGRIKFSLTRSGLTLCPSLAGQVKIPQKINRTHHSISAHECKATHCLRVNPCLAPFTDFFHHLLNSKPPKKCSVLIRHFTKNSLGQETMTMMIDDHIDETREIHSASRPTNFHDYKTVNAIFIILPAFTFCSVKSLNNINYYKIKKNIEISVNPIFSS